MNNLISRQAVFDALIEKGQNSKRYKLGENWELNLPEIIEAINAIPFAESEWKGKCTKINCPIQMNYISNDCDIKTCLYRTEHKNGKWKNIALFTRECSECGAQFHELEYDNFCPNCGADMRGE